MFIIYAITEIVIDGTLCMKAESLTDEMRILLDCHFLSNLRGLPILKELRSNDVIVLIISPIKNIKPSGFLIISPILGVCSKCFKTRGFLLIWIKSQNLDDLLLEI